MIDESTKGIEHFTFPVTGKRRAVATNMNEGDLSDGQLTIEPVVAFEGKVKNSLVFILKRLGLLRLLYSTSLVDIIAQPRATTDDETIYLTASSGDARIDIESDSDYVTAAASAVAFAQLALDDGTLTGVKIPAQVFTLEETLVHVSDVVRRVEPG